MAAGADPFAAAFAALPLGAFVGRSAGRRYRVVRQVVAGGRGGKLEAWEIGGPDYVSLNLYHLTDGPRLRPCEMPEAKVRAFVAGLVVEGEPAPEGSGAARVDGGP